MFETTNDTDIIDSRDIINRVEELAEREEFWAMSKSHREAEKDTQVYAEGPLNGDEAEELAELRAVAAQGETLDDWVHGETLIRDDYFTEYAKQTAEDLGCIDREAGWPSMHIDWEAAAADLQTDYTDIDYNGVTYWAR